MHLYCMLVENLRGINSCLVHLANVIAASPTMAHLYVFCYDMYVHALAASCKGIVSSSQFDLQYTELTNAY